MKEPEPKKPASASTVLNENNKVEPPKNKHKLLVVVILGLFVVGFAIGAYFGYLGVRYLLQSRQNAQKEQEIKKTTQQDNIENTSAGVTSGTNKVIGDPVH